MDSPQTVNVHDTQFHDSNLDILNIQHVDNETNNKEEINSDRSMEKQDKLETSTSSISDGILTEELIENSQCLANLNKTADGCSLAYLNMNASNLQLHNISILEQYGHIQVINLSNNNLTCLDPLAHLPYLIDLNVSYNNLTKLLDFEPPFALRSANFSFNNITEIPDLQTFSRLKDLDVRNNKITDISPGLLNAKHLQKLSLGHNKISEIKNLDYLPLTHLDLQNNLIKQANNVETLTKLQYLNLGDNKIKTIKPLQHLKSLYHLDISNNQLIDLIEIRHITCLSYLREIILVGNPIENIPDYRLLIIFELPSLTHIDHKRVLVEEKVNAVNQESPSLEIIAQRDHRLNMVYSFFQPHYVYDSTLQSSDTPYPMLVLVGPNGSMKKELALKLVHEFPEYFGYGVSHTTRPPFPGEENGREYVFAQNVDFESLQLKGKFIQTALFQNNFYGLTTEAVESVAREGLACVVHMELEGVLALKKTYFEPRYVLTLPLNKYLHEKHLRMQQRPEHHIMESVRRSEIYVKYNQDHPGFFDMVISTDDIVDAYDQLKLLVMNYLGLVGIEEENKSKPMTEYTSTGPGKPLSRTWSKTSQQSSLFNNSRPLVPHVSGKGRVEEASMRQRHSAAKEVIASGKPRGRATEFENHSTLHGDISGSESESHSARLALERLDLGSSGSQGLAGIASSNPKAPRSRNGLLPPTGATTYSPAVM